MLTIVTSSDWAGSKSVEAITSLSPTCQLVYTKVVKVVASGIIVSYNIVHDGYFSIPCIST